MIVTIIGSLSKKEDMFKIKEFFEDRGHTVNCPADPELQKEPLLIIQQKWIRKIEEADLIVVVSKCIVLEGNGNAKHTLTLGESTSYELAIATRFQKQILFM